MGAESNEGPFLGMRHAQSLLLFLDMLAVYVCRWNISVAVIAMTNGDNANPDFPAYHWNEKQLSYIHSSFFWGYILTQYPGGVLCKHYGVKIVLGWATLATAVFSVLIPGCVGWGDWQAFCALRVLQGLAQGLVFPCIFAHVAKWSPLKERNRLGAFALAGLDCGTLLAMAINGVIVKGPMGWPGVFYVSGGICFVWCVLWWFFGANTPRDSKFITAGERQYIESSMLQTGDGLQKKIPTPWKAVGTSGPFMVSLIVRCAVMWGISTFATQIPAYLNGVLHMEIKSNALFSAMPFLASWLLTYVFVALGDILQQRNVLSLTALRRLFSSIACWIPAMAMIAIGFLDEQNKSWALSLMTICVGLQSGNIIGSSLNIIDLTPNHTGVLYSIVNTTASLMPLLSPLVVGVIVSDMNNRSQWQIVFAISAAIFFFSNLLYIIFGSTDAQPWDAEDFLMPKDTDCSTEDLEDSKKR